MSSAVSVRGIRKKYSRRAADHLGYGVRDLLAEILGRRRTQELRPDEFWAVDDVSFEIDNGASFALVGRNGSGKSTLLKLIAGLIRPEAGTIHTRGRIQALIALGAGFNPLLSGRENVFVAGALLGLSRQQTEGLLDAIIDFAEIGDFIDSPVRTYSSGMYARLGFSLAVNLEPDVLLIDEILSVGDFGFQNKCFGRLSQLKKNGITIVLVSHSHTRIIQLCDRALWLHDGKPREIGGAQDVVRSYLDFLDVEKTSATLKPAAKPDAKPAAKPAPATKEAPAQKAAPASDAGESPYGPIHPGDGMVDDVTVEIAHQGLAGGLPMHTQLRLRFSFRLLREVDGLNVTFAFYRVDGLHLTSISTLNGDLAGAIHGGRVEGEIEIDDLHLVPGHYVVVMPIHERHSYLYRGTVAEFVVRGDGALTWGLTDFPHRIEIRRS